MFQSLTETGMNHLAGPILRAGPTADCIVQAIRELNPGAQVFEKGAYVRVGAEQKCLLTKAKLENITGYAIRFPLDLEQIMVSFQGKLLIDSDMALWISDDMLIPDEL